jgi:hypothetical protein
MATTGYLDGFCGIQVKHFWWVSHPFGNWQLRDMWRKEGREKQWKEFI